MSVCSFVFPRVLFLPVGMLMVPPRHYCVISNPVCRDEENRVLFDQSGQAKLRHADLEIRLSQDPFPLYPGEEVQQVLRLSITRMSMLRLKSLDDAEIIHNQMKLSQLYRGINMLKNMLEGTCEQEVTEKNLNLNTNFIYSYIVT